ncbi:hypothetical protein LMG7053_05726 [Achromobacter ruhlandii]|uniref:Uncharacterized protein n=1 Tax=Achromobacter ruhlandii TaxID=72557 RepID=A0ABM8M3D9_9BURK|nr:hypothetical protein LMG7053_05726 [Achromobacter ruhlandii]
MLALGVGLRVEVGLARVLVGHIQLAAGGQVAVFLDRAGVVARLARGDDGGIVGAGDGDRDGFGGGAAVAVVNRDGDGVGDRLAVLEGLDLVAAIVQRVGPLAGAIHRERAVLALAAVVDGPGVRVVGVDVVLGQLAGHGVAGVVLADFADGGAADGRGVVGAGDGDRDDLGGLAAVAVVDGNRDGIGHLLAFGQGLHLVAAVVQHVGPLAVLVDREGAVLTLAAVVGGPGVRVAGVDVGLGQLARHFLRAVFLDGAGGFAADGRGVVGAVDGDGDRASGAIGGGDGEGLGQLLAHGQRLYARVGLVQVVDPVAVGVDREGAVHARAVGHGHEEGLTVVGVDHVELAVGGGFLVLDHGAGIVARLGGGDLGRVIDADHGHFHGGGGGGAARVGDDVGDRGGSRLAFGQMLEAVAGNEGVAAVRQHGEGAAVGTGDADAARAHRAAADRDQGQRIAVGIAVVDQQVAAHDAFFVGAGGVIDGQGRVIVVARGATVAARAAGSAVDRVGAPARVGIGQVQRAGGFQDAGQAHEAAAAVVTAAARQRRGGRIQHFERILAGLQGRQQAVGIGALGRRHRGFGRIGQRAGHVAGDGHLAAFADHDRHAILHLQRHAGARGRDDVAAGGHVAALMQFGQRAIAVAYPGATGDFSDDGGGGVGHVGSVSGSYPRWPDTRGSRGAAVLSSRTGSGKDFAAGVGRRRNAVHPQRQLQPVGHFEFVEDG